MLETQEEILKDLHDFYSELYTSKGGIVNNDYLANIKIPQIDEGDKYVLEGLLVFEEIDIASRQLKSNKCPRNDGLPIEFYRKFWGKIKNLLFQVHLDSIKLVKLNPRCNQFNG